jgi:AraC family transcriptional regulator
MTLFRATTNSVDHVIIREEVAGASLAEHRHESHMLRMQLRGGTINEWTKGRRAGRSVLEPGTLALIPAGEYHTSCINRAAGKDKSLQLVNLVPASLLLRVSESVFSRTLVQLTETREFRDPQLRSLLILLRAATAESISDSLFGESLRNALAVRLLEKHSTAAIAPKSHRGGIHGRTLKRVLEEIDETLANQLTLASLAEAAGMSVYHFSHAFKASMGMSPYQYVLSRRVERAKELLRDSDLTIEAISIGLGFSHQNHLSRTFKDRTGVTPMLFRRETRSLRRLELAWSGAPDRP